MARPLPVNLLLAGTGAVLLVSGVGGEPIGEVLKGQFGNLKPGQQQQQASAVEGGGATAQNADYEGEPQTSYGPSTFAPSPTTLDRHVSKQQEAKSIAAILLSRGITNPTNKQIEEAQAFYHTK